MAKLRVCCKLRRDHSARSNQSLVLGFAHFADFCGPLDGCQQHFGKFPCYKRPSLAPLRGRTISLLMLAMRGGISIGSLITGISVNLLGVRYALLINGLLALATHIMIGRHWIRTALPTPRQTL